MNMHSELLTPTISATPSSSVICAGFSATVTASGSNTYTWSDGATTTYTVMGFHLADQQVQRLYKAYHCVQVLRKL